MLLNNIMFVIVTNNYITSHNNITLRRNCTNFTNVHKLLLTTKSTYFILQITASRTLKL